jgi:hypothetical protein
LKTVLLDIHGEKDIEKDSKNVDALSTLHLIQGGQAPSSYPNRKRRWR